MTNIIVSSGQTISAIVLKSGGDTVQVLSGGTFEDSLIEGGQVMVSNGGQALQLDVIASGSVINSGITSGDFLSGGGVETINGGIAEATIVAAGGTLNLSHGTASSAVLSSGGLLLYYGGAIADLSVSSGGVIGLPFVFTGSAVISGNELAVINGHVTNATIGLSSAPSGLSFVVGQSPLDPVAFLHDDILIGSAYVVSSGVTSEGRTFNGGDTLAVQSGGVAEGNTFGGAAAETIASGAAASGEILLGGLQTVSAGGSSLDVSATALGGVVSQGARLRDYGVVSGATLGSGAGLIVEFGGTASAVTLLSGGGLTVLPGGGAYGVTAQDGATIDVSSAAVSGLTLANGASFSDDGAGSLAGLAVTSGGRFQLGFGALSPDHALVNFGSGRFVLYGSQPGPASFSLAAGVSAGLAAGFEASDGGDYGGHIFVGSGYVASAGVASSGLTLGGGDTLTVASGGSASGVTLGNAGALYVSSGGSETAATVLSGGAAEAEAGGVTIGDAVSSAGDELVLGTASATQVDSGGVLYAFSGGVAVSATLYSGGQAFVSSGGVASGMAVDPGGAAFVFSGGVASGGSVAASGMIEALSGGSALAVTLVGGVLTVDSGGFARGTVIGQGSALVDGVASGTLVESGGTEVVRVGGDSVGATVHSGGVEELFGGAISDLGVAAGAAIDLAFVNATSASVNSAGQLMAINGAGVVVATIGLRGPVAGLAISLASDHADGTLISVTSGISVTSAASSDYDANGFSDLTWRNTNGEAGIWLTTAAGGYAAVDFGRVDNSWRIQSIGDFNGDGKADILWRNAANGQVGEWLSNPGPGYTGFTTPILATVDLAWQIQGVGDFDGDGRGDILWRNTNGDAGIWLTTAGGGFSAVDFGVVDNAWRMQAAGDFNGDGKADILWRNNATGQVGEWLSNAGAGYAGFTTPILATVDLSWKIQGAGDFDGDGRSDILWRNTNGDTGVWLTTGGGFTAVDFGVVDLNWSIQGVGDYNGDGKADILWRNAATGQVGEWLSNPAAGFTGFTAPILATVESSWTPQGMAPALQANQVTAAPLAQAMAAMGPGSGVGDARAGPGAASPLPVLAVAARMRALLNT